MVSVNITSSEKTVGQPDRFRLQVYVSARIKVTANDLLSWAEI